MKIDFVLILTWFITLQYLLDAFGIWLTGIYIKYFGWPITFEEILEFLSLAKY